MLKEVQGNLLDDDADALVNAVNCVGVMGSGIARAFRSAYPEMYRAYKARCESDSLGPGRMDTHMISASPSRWIINFPTKDDFRDSSKLIWIEDGLSDLVRVISDLGIRSIALPALGCGRGGLAFSRVRPIICRYLGDIPDVDVRLYSPLLR